MPKKSKVARLTTQQERQVAVEAQVDPRTVRAYLEGKPGRSLVVERVKAALAKLGLPS